MAKCLRCGAGNEWIQGRVRDELAPQGPREALDMLRIMVLELNKNAGRISEETLTQAELLLKELLCLAREGDWDE